MEKIFNKLLEKVDAAAETYRSIRKHTYCRTTETNDCDGCRADHYLEARLSTLNDMKEMVKQVAEDYKPATLHPNTLLKPNPERDEFIKESIQDSKDVIFLDNTNDTWILCSEQMPKEQHDSRFAKHFGISKKMSDDVIVTVVDETGDGVTTYAYTCEGVWKCDLLRFNQSYRIVAWMPFPERYRP